MQRLCRDARQPSRHEDRAGEIRRVLGTLRSL